MDIISLLNGNYRAKGYRASKDLIFLLIIATAFALRLYSILVSTYLWDEDRDWIILAESISLQQENFNLPIRGYHHPILPAYLIKAGSILLGKNPVGFRFSSLLAGLITIVIAFKLVKEWVGLTAAYWSACLLAFNEYHIAISTLAVEKSFYIFFALLAIYVFCRFLQTEQPKYLSYSMVATGLCFLCKEISALLIPIFFLALFFYRYRHWLRRREPYCAFLIFLVIISPDLYWNMMNPVLEGSRLNYWNHLSRIGGLGFNGHYFLFYGRHAIQAIYDILGKKIFDPAAEYSAMNSLFGVVLFGGVLLTTFRNKQEDPISKFLVCLFWMVLGFFLLIRPGVPRGNLDPYVWFYIDITLLPSILLTGRFLSRLRGKWRLPVYTVIGAAALYATVMVLLFPKNVMPKVAVSPEFLWPADGRMVKVNTKFNFCSICNSNPKIELVDIKIVHGNGVTEPGINTLDVEGANLDTDDRMFYLRATFGSDDESRRGYKIIYRVTDESRSYIIWSGVGVFQKQSQIWRRPVFWAR